MWNLQISPSGQNDNTGGSNEKYGIFVQALTIQVDRLKVEGF